MVEEQLATENLLRRGVDWIFGYDFFISYSHNDGINYPKRLKQLLEQMGYRVFLDQTEYVPGADLRRETRRQVTKSQKIVIIGRSSALKSQWVKREVDVAIDTSKIPIIININGAVEAAGPDAVVAATALDCHWLRLEELLGDSDGEPSEYSIGELVRSFKHTRQETKRLRVFAAAAGLLALLALGVGVAALAALNQKIEAERNLAIAKEAADGLVFDIARGLRDVEGLRVDSVRRILERSGKAFGRLLESDPSSLDLQRSRASMLGEFAVTYLAVGDIDGAKRAAQQAAEISESLLIKDPSNRGMRRDLALNLSRFADVLTEKGDLPEAREVHKRALGIRSQLLMMDPNDIDVARDRTVSLTRLGEIAETLGDFKAALKFFEQVLDLRRSLVAQRPQWQRDLTVGYIKIGDIKLSLGDVSGASNAFEDATVNARKLQMSDNTSTRFWRDLAVALQRQGNIGLRIKKPDIAITAFIESLGSFKELARLDPENLEWSNDIAISQFKLGQAEVMKRNNDQARHYFQGALKARRDLLAKSPENHQLRTDIAENLMELAMISPVERTLYFREARALLIMLKGENRIGPEQDKWLESINLRLVRPRS